MTRQIELTKAEYDLLSPVSGSHQRKHYNFRIGDLT